MIGVDWGTTSLRAFRLAPDGTILARREAKRGILQVGDDAFPAVLREQVHDWIADGETRVLLSGMIGSRQGWVEAPYLPCPASPASLAAALVDVPFADAQTKLVPGLTDRDAAGVPEVMRGEETQLVGVLAAFGDAGIACLPGTHSKWVRLADGGIAGYSTHMTGEVFSALRGHTILGRLMEGDTHRQGAFDRGLARSGEAGGLLHHLFGVRALGLHGELDATDSASYLSGLLIGHEIRAAGGAGEPVHVIGAAALSALYVHAIAALGGTARLGDDTAAARGLARIAELAAWH